ncbi:S1C family serine protease [Neobacillus sp. D3-1R]|uniref:S1C family serine protease n=1 Tax=Neobacillus sp. D3-1R TaxID=3445778 RepID=UPI003FA0E3DE
MSEFNNELQTNHQSFQTPENEIQPSRYEEPVNVKKTGRSPIKGFISLVAAGVVGSALTLTVAPHTDYFQKMYQTEVSKPVQNNVQSTTASITPTQTAMKTTNGSIADIVENASKAIVGIVNIQNQNNFFSGSSESVQTGSGSGVIFKKTNDAAYIVTNNHVIEGANEVEISFFDGEKTKAKLVGADALTDLAVLKIDPKYAKTILDFGDSSVLRPGDQVLAIGNPLGLDLSRTVTQGIVSAVDRSVPVSTSAGEWELNVIQTDAAINPGNSGGALINTQGQVIGINSMKISNSGVEGLGFAIPSNDLVPIVNQMIENGKVVRPYMGVSLVSLEEVPQEYVPTLPEKVKQGAMITFIDPNSAADKAGLLKQDVIVSINDKEVKASGDIRKYLYAHSKVGDQVTLKLYRQGKLMTVQMNLTSNQNTN